MHWVCRRATWSPVSPEGTAWQLPAMPAAASRSFIGSDGPQGHSSLELRIWTAVQTRPSGLSAIILRDRPYGRERLYAVPIGRSPIMPSRRILQLSLDTPLEQFSELVPVSSGSAALRRGPPWLQRGGPAAAKRWISPLVGTTLVRCSGSRWLSVPAERGAHPSDVTPTGVSGDPSSHWRYVEFG